MATEAQDFFKHCVPVVTTTMGRCGSPTICENTLPETLADLETTFGSGEGGWKIIGDLLMSNFELKASSCGIKQRGFRDMITANIKNVKHMMSPDNFSAVDKRMRPYLLAPQKVPINNISWQVSGEASGNEVEGVPTWALTATSTGGIPAEARAFQAGEFVFVEGVTEGGSLNHWQGEVVGTPTVSGNSVVMELIPRNENTYFDNVENPTAGILYRGNKVVGQYQQWCSDEPTYLNKRMQDYWIEWARHTFKDCEITNEFFDYVLKKNPLYKTFFHQPKLEAAHQALEAFWDKLFNNWMFKSPSNPNQNLTDFRNLPTQDIYLNEELAVGFNGGQCVGYLAENVGWMQQWQRCKSIVDLQGDALNIWSIIDLCYDLKRTRFQTGSPATVRMAAFADLSTAELVDTGFMALQDQRTGGNFRITMDVNGTNPASNPFGFQFQSYRLPGKGRGIILDVITDDAFDDYISMWSNLNNEDAGRNMWFLDPTNFYVGVVHSERTLNSGGTLADLARISAGHQCVQKVMSQSTDILGVAFASIVECAARDRLLRNFSADTPSIVKADRPDYTLTHNPAYYSDY